MKIIITFILITLLLFTALGQNKTVKTTRPTWPNVTFDDYDHWDGPE